MMVNIIQIFTISNNYVQPSAFWTSVAIEFQKQQESP